jgi:hypothetical protein
LLQLTKLAPAAADRATDDVAILISHEAGHCLHFMQWRRLVIEVTESSVDDGALFRGQVVMRLVTKLQHGVSPAA